MEEQRHHNTTTTPAYHPSILNAIASLAAYPHYPDMERHKMVVTGRTGTAMPPEMHLPVDYQRLELLVHQRFMDGNDTITDGGVHDSVNVTELTLAEFWLTQPSLTAEWMC
jgi:hypothetical protein